MSKAKPTDALRRMENYFRQGARTLLTPRQMRRVRHKRNRAIAREAAS